MKKLIVNTHSNHYVQLASQKVIKYPSSFPLVYSDDLTIYRDLQFNIYFDLISFSVKFHLHTAFARRLLTGSHRKKYFLFRFVRHISAVICRSEILHVRWDLHRLR